MFRYWMELILISGIIPGMCSSNHLTSVSKKHILSVSRKDRFQFEKRGNIFPFERVADDNIATKRGSFKIDDGKVIGGGIYEIYKDQVDIDIKLKITPDYEESTTKLPCIPSSKPTPPIKKPTAAATAPETAGPSSSSRTTAVPSVSVATPAAGAKDDEKEALELHNKFRKIHDAPAMTLNAEMSQSAASYAAKLAQMGSLSHSSREERDNNGENLSYGCSSSEGQTVTEAVTGWYNEVCGYKFGSEGMGGAGHFTQLVWKASLELGFGKADSEKRGMKCTYYVARYKPAGNVAGEYAKNVVKGSFDRNYCNNIKKSNFFKRFRGKIIEI